MIVSQGPEQTLERLPSHNHRHAQMFAILMFTKHTSRMGELPYMVVSLAEDCNNVGQKTTHRQTRTLTSKTPFAQMM